MISLFTLSIPKKVWFSHQKRCDFHTRNGMIFILLLVWYLYCLWYDLYTVYGMIFILLVVWSLYRLWYDLYTAYGMIFIPLLVWSLYCFWYDIYTVYVMNIWYNCHIPGNSIRLNLVLLLCMKNKYCITKNTKWKHKWMTPKI